MPIVKFQMSDGRVAKFEVPDGTTPEQASAFATQYFSQSENQNVPRETEQPFFTSLGDFGTDESGMFRVAGLPVVNTQGGIGGVAQRIGRSAAQQWSAALEGVAELGDIVVSPATTAARAAGFESQPMAETVRQVSEAVGVPEPYGPLERTMAGAAKVVGPAAATMGTGALMAPAKGVAGEVGKMLASQPAQQLASATAAGISGNVAKEQGAGGMGQFTAALAGGLAPMTLQKITSGAINTLGKGVSSAADEVLSGIDMKDMSISMRNELRTQVKKALKTGSLDKAQLNRYVDYLKVGATPTRGRVTLKPGDITFEKNLAKAGMNSQDEALQVLGNIERQNDIVLMQRLDELGAANADDALSAGSKLINTLKSIDAPRKAAVNNAYKMVRDSSGKYADLDSDGFTTTARKYLTDEELIDVLPTKVSKILTDVYSGKRPLNVRTMMQIDKKLSDIKNQQFVSGKPQAALSVSMVQRALRETGLSVKKPLKPTSTQIYMTGGKAYDRYKDSVSGNSEIESYGKETIKLYEKARSMYASRAALIDDTPALRAALENTDPDKFIQTFITGTGGKANYSDVKSLANELSNSPEAFDIAKNQITSFLKNKALSGNADEVANFSQANYNKALNSIGDAKLKLFFGKEELDQLKRIGRVASYEKFQPSGSAVNTSNTAATMIGKAADMSGNVLGLIPGVGRYAGPMSRNALSNVAAGREARLALSPTLVNRLSRKGGAESLAAPLAGIIAAQ